MEDFWKSVQTIPGSCCGLGAALSAVVQGRETSTYDLCRRSGDSRNGSVHQLMILLFSFRPVKVCCFDGNFLYLILQGVYTGMVAVTGQMCYDRTQIFEVKRYFLIDITESRG